MISIKSISVARDANPVVKGFSAEFRAGTVTAIIGPNGCGKSTLLLAMAGDLPIASGEILINGSDSIS
jgi:iron complex transport system ATP-binding protein